MGTGPDSEKSSLTGFHRDDLQEAYLLHHERRPGPCRNCKELGERKGAPSPTLRSETEAPCIAGLLFILARFAVTHKRVSS